MQPASGVGSRGPRGEPAAPHQLCWSSLPTHQPPRPAMGRRLHLVSIAALGRRENFLFVSTFLVPVLLTTHHTRTHTHACNDKQTGTAGGMSSQSHICMVEIRGWDAREHPYGPLTVTGNQYSRLGKKTHTHISGVDGWISLTLKTMTDEFCSDLYAF